MDKLRKEDHQRDGGSGSGAYGSQPVKKLWAYAAVAAVIVVLIIVSLCS